jgi:hypothetical protein
LKSKSILVVGFFRGVGLKQGMEENFFLSPLPPFAFFVRAVCLVRFVPD